MTNLARQLTPLFLVSSRKRGGVRSPFTRAPRTFFCSRSVPLELTARGERLSFDDDSFPLFAWPLSSEWPRFWAEMPLWCGDRRGLAHRAATKRGARTYKRGREDAFRACTNATRYDVLDSSDSEPEFRTD